MTATQTVLDNVAKLRAAVPETVAEIERQAVAQAAVDDAVDDQSSVADRARSDPAYRYMLMEDADIAARQANDAIGTERWYWPRFIVKTASWYVRRRKWAGLIRSTWRALVLHDNGETCQECGRGYFLWHATNKAWRAVQGDKGGGLFCPSCFDRKAEAAGMPLVWIARSWREDDPGPAEAEWDR